MTDFMSFLFSFIKEDGMNSTKNPKIRISDLVPNSFVTEEIDDGYVKISYSMKGRGNRPKSFVFPKYIEVSKEFIEY